VSYLPVKKTMGINMCIVFLTVRYDMFIPIVFLIGRYDTCLFPLFFLTGRYDTCLFPLFF
jgi:hypothetical protein